MKRLVRSACALLAGFLATSGAVMLSDRLAEPKEIRLGRLNMSDYCRREYGATATAQPTERPSAFGWRCFHYPNGTFDAAEIDVDEACALLYGTPAHTLMGAPDDPYGWECVRD